MRDPLVRKPVIVYREATHTIAAAVAAAAPASAAFLLGGLTVRARSRDRAVGQALGFNEGSQEMACQVCVPLLSKGAQHARVQRVDRAEQQHRHQVAPQPDQYPAPVRAPRLQHGVHLAPPLKREERAGLAPDQLHQHHGGKPQEGLTAHVQRTVPPEKPPQTQCALSWRLQVLTFIILCYLAHRTSLLSIPECSRSNCCHTKCHAALAK
mmetsp:Transcript_129213/g.359828  ORF Transcript_129213/g.359828 Transcript_129213/m.359828 type:complete len:210 (+) Transcript_129213:154-783(+)